MRSLKAFVALLAVVVFCSEKSRSNIVDNGLMSYAEENVPWSEHNTDIRTLRSFLKTVDYSMKAQFLAYALNQKDTLPVDIVNEIEVGIELLTVNVFQSRERLGKVLGYLAPYRADLLLALLLSDETSLGRSDYHSISEKVSVEVFLQFVSLFNLIRANEVLDIGIECPENLLFARETINGLSYYQDRAKLWVNAYNQREFLPKTLQLLVMTEIDRRIRMSDKHKTHVSRELAAVACGRADWIRTFLVDSWWSFEECKDKIDLSAMPLSVFKEVLASLKWPSLDDTKRLIRKVMEAFEFMTRPQQELLTTKLAVAIYPFFDDFLRGSKHYMSYILPKYLRRDIEKGLKRCGRISAPYTAYAYILNNYLGETSYGKFYVSEITDNSYKYMFMHDLPAEVWCYVKPLESVFDVVKFIDEARYTIDTSEHCMRGFLEFAVQNSVLYRVYKNPRFLFMILRSGVTLHKDAIVELFYDQEDGSDYIRDAKFGLITHFLRENLDKSYDHSWFSNIKLKFLAYAVDQKDSIFMDETIAEIGSFISKTSLSGLYINVPIKEEMGYLARYRAEWLLPFIMSSKVREVQFIDIEKLSDDVFNEVKLLFDLINNRHVLKITIHLRKDLLEVKKALLQLSNSDKIIFWAHAFDQIKRVPKTMQSIILDEIGHDLSNVPLPKKTLTSYSVCAYLLTHYLDETSQRDYCLSLFSKNDYRLMFEYKFPAKVWHYMKPLDTEEDKSAYIDRFSWTIFTSKDCIRGFLYFAAKNNVPRVFNNPSLFTMIVLSGVELKDEELSEITDANSANALDQLQRCYNRNKEMILKLNAQIKTFLDANEKGIDALQGFAWFLKMQWIGAWKSRNLLK